MNTTIGFNWNVLVWDHATAEISFGTFGYLIDVGARDPGRFFLLNFTVDIWGIRNYHHCSSAWRCTPWGSVREIRVTTISTATRLLLYFLILNPCENLMCIAQIRPLQIMCCKCRDSTRVRGWAAQVNQSTSFQWTSRLAVFGAHSPRSGRGTAVYALPAPAVSSACGKQSAVRAAGGFPAFPGRRSVAVILEWLQFYALLQFAFFSLTWPIDNEGIKACLDIRKFTLNLYKQAV